MTGAPSRWTAWIFLTAFPNNDPHVSSVERTTRSAMGSSWDRKDVLRSLRSWSKAKGIRTGVPTWPEIIVSWSVDSGIALFASGEDMREQIKTFLELRA